MYFLSELHLQNFREAIELIPNARPGSGRRLSTDYAASLFLLAGLEEAWPSLRRFCCGYIDCGSILEALSLSTGEQLVVRLAGNLYNGGFWEDTPADLVNFLDDRYFRLCLSALKIRRAKPLYDRERGIIL